MAHKVKHKNSAATTLYCPLVEWQKRDPQQRAEGLKFIFKRGSSFIIGLIH
ncbi:hypothetical protein PAENIP36_37880 [Paenibacillus sp. P36]